jgi:histone acetyltransferase 1
MALTEVSIQLHFVATATDFNAPGVTPTCTHFIQESLQDFQALEIDVYMHAGSMKPYFNITYEDKGSADLLTLLKSQLELPSCFASPLELSEALQQPFVPPGKLVSSYVKGGVTCSIYLASAECPEFLEMHPYLNTLPMWFIDGASLIDITEPHWRYFLLYKDCSLVGVCSVYYFWSSLSTCRARISQFLILPQYQRQGFGAEFLQTIYAHFRSDDRVFEITVEDCSEEMQKLRDVVDIQAALQWMPWAHSPVTAQAYPKSSAEDEDVLRKNLKVTRNQANRCLELAKLGLLANDKGQEFTEWRREVKRRLLRDNYQELKPEDTQQQFKHIYIHDDSEAEEQAEALAQIKAASPVLYEQLGKYLGMKPVPHEGKSVSERIEALGEMFEAVEEEYRSVLPKVRRVLTS